MQDHKKQLKPRKQSAYRARVCVVLDSSLLTIRQPGGEHLWSERVMLLAALLDRTMPAAIPEA
jgi:hypothetical protein